MNVKIKVIKDFTNNEKAQLEKINIKVNTGWDDFEINADNVNLSNIQNILKDSDWDSISQREAIFSEKDRTNASFLNVYANKMLGYAKPDGDEVDNYPYPFNIYPYYKNVVEISNTDDNYGLLRGHQIGLYSLSGEPKWGNKGIASAHYIEDVFFVKPEIYEEIFKPLNIKSCPVLNYKTGEYLKTVLQIVQQDISPVKLSIKDEQIEEVIYIDKWKLKKHILKNDIYYPSFISIFEGLDFFYTQEYFGDGGINQRNTIISQKLYQILKNNNIKGLNFYPMAE